MRRLRGWIYKVRDHGKIVFLDLRCVEDPTRIFQVVCKEDILGKEKMLEIKKLNREDCVEVFGDVVKNERAPGGEELILKEFKVIFRGEIFPLGKEKPSPETEWTYRHLVIRSIRYARIFYIRDKIANLFRKWFAKEGYYEVFPPILQPVQCEGGATLFPVKWFDEGYVYLSQSAQLYLEALIFSLGKVYSLTPSFRAERSRTRRHLAEYWHLEAEVAFYSNKDMMDDEERMIKYVLENLISHDKSLKILREFRGKGVDLIKRIVEEEWPRIKYSEAVSLLNEKGIDISYGEDLGSDEERVLMEMFETPVFVVNYPKEIKAFYMRISENGKEVENHDLLAPEGYGEVIGGSERETRIDLLIKRLEEMGEDIKNYEWYLDLRRYGNVTHSGFGLGLERFVMWVLRLEHIRETLPFPRLPRLRDFPEIMRGNL